MTFSYSVLILGTFSGSAVMNKILNVEILEIIYLKSQNLKKLQRRGKLKICGNLGASCFRPVHHCQEGT